MAYDDGDTLVRVVMHNVTGLPEDDCINDFAFTFPDVLDEASYLLLLDWVDAFYNVPDTGEQPPGAYISEAINRSATHRMDFYKIQAGALGSPVYSSPWLGPIAPLSGNNLPAECAAVLSFHATLVGTNEEEGVTRPRARRRGRIFLGPLTTDVYTVSSSNPRFDSGFLSRCRFAMGELRDTSQASDPLSVGWGVWSRADAVVRPVVGGWTDDAFDTQRRRGVAATARVNWGNP